MLPQDDAHEVPVVRISEWKEVSENLTFIGPCIVIYFYSKTN